MSVTIRLKQDEPVTLAVLTYLSDFTNNLVLDDIEEDDKHNKSFDDENSGDSGNSDSDSSITLDNELNLKNPNTKRYVKLLADFGEYHIDYKDNTISVQYQRESTAIGLMDSIDCLEKLTITCNSCNSKDENLDILKQFILNVEQNSKPEKKDKISCYIADEGYWKFLSSNPKRKLDTVFHPKRDEIYTDVKSFNENEDDYKIHGIPYKRNYLFYGPPGTGKTSMLCALASEFNADLYLVNFTSKITDPNFMRLVSKMPSGSIMVLEDIDALFIERVIMMLEIVVKLVLVLF